MLRRIIEWLQAKLISTDYFEKVWELCVLKENIAEGIKEPMRYKGSNEYESVRNFDHKNGSAYFRKNGNITVARADEEMMRSCSEMVKITFPIKAIICVPREKIRFDDEYAEDLLAQTVMKLVSDKSTAIKTQIKAYRVAVQVTSYSTDTVRILQEEMSPVKNDINYKLIYMSMDLNVEVVIDKNCIEDECEFDGCYTYSYN